eukprot:11035352-Heterocapsa_arctica.AAC.1
MTVAIETHDGPRSPTIAQGYDEAAAVKRPEAVKALRRAQIRARIPRDRDDELHEPQRAGTNESLPSMLEEAAR